MFPRNYSVLEGDSLTRRKSVKSVQNGRDVVAVSSSDTERAAIFRTDCNYFIWPSADQANTTLLVFLLDCGAHRDFYYLRLKNALTYLFIVIYSAVYASLNKCP